MTRARYHVYAVQMPAPGRAPLVWIVDDYNDHQPTMSVTNDAEAVCAELHAQWPNHRIIYRDTEGKWDELLHKAGAFTGFAPARDMAPPFNRREA